MNSSAEVKLGNSRIYCLPPLVTLTTKFLIVGTMPSNHALKQGLYYANPKNLFWDIILRIARPSIGLFDSIKEVSFNERFKMLDQLRIGLWDSLESCERIGNTDSKIKNPIVNNFQDLIGKCRIQHIFFNGQKAKTYFFDGNSKTDISFSLLSSSSPMNPNNAFHVIRDWREQFLTWKVLKH